MIGIYACRVHILNMMMMMMHRIRVKEDNDSMFAPNNNVESH